MEIYLRCNDAQQQSLLLQHADFKPLLILHVHTAVLLLSILFYKAKSYLQKDIPAYFDR